MTQSPRISYNAELAAVFVQQHRITSRYPKVTSQLPVLPLELRSLVAGGYNPSIVRQGEGLLMAYRYHEEQSHSTKLALAEVTMGGSVQSNRLIEFDGDPLSREDPKLFAWQNAIWMAWVESAWPTQPVSSVVKYGRLEGSRLVQSFQVRPPNPKPIEKNLVPLTHEGKLYFIYESQPEQKILEVSDGTVGNQLASPPAFWPYGDVRGGSSPIPYRGQLLRFFHSGVDKEWGQTWPRRYFLGAVMMDAKPPFSVRQISSKPIAMGSEVCDVRVSQRPFHYKSNVIFPGGAVEYNGEWLVACGVNDSQCTVLKVKEGQLNFK